MKKEPSIFLFGKARNLFEKTFAQDLEMDIRNEFGLDINAYLDLIDVGKFQIQLASPLPHHWRRPDHDEIPQPFAQLLFGPTAQYKPVLLFSNMGIPNAMITLGTDEVIAVHKQNTRYYKAKRYKAIVLESCHLGLTITVEL